MESRLTTAHWKRFIIYHQNPEYNEALERASWDLNTAGVRKYHEALLMHDSKVFSEKNYVTFQYFGQTFELTLKFYYWQSIFYFQYHIIFCLQMKNMSLTYDGVIEETYTGRQTKG